MSADLLTHEAVDAPTLVDLLRERACRHPDRLLFTFLADGDTVEANLTCYELEQRAQAIATTLRQTVAPGARALLLYPSGLEFISAFFGCLYAGVVAVPAYPPHPARLERTLPRLLAILSDARPQIGLTTAAILPLVEPFAELYPNFRSLAWRATDTIALTLTEQWADPGLNAETVALLQYTSGSTATPKGVIVTHGNLMHNLGMIQRGFDATSEDIILGWLPLYHDMGLIGQVLQPVYIGAQCFLMSPAAFLQRPVRWLQAISRHRATGSGGPNFAYELCVRKVTPEQRAALDLSCWRRAFNGAEPVRHETLERFATVFAPAGFRREAFYPCYGLAEATLFVAGDHGRGHVTVRTIDRAALGRGMAVDASEGEASLPLVSSGQPAPELTLLIVDPQTRLPCEPGHIGEVWITGPSVARGYWDNPEETRRTFEAYLADESTGPFLRTGDTGFVKNGELFVTGRLKDLIIIRGVNHYPQDIEATVEGCHPALRPNSGAAFSVEVGGEERLVVIHEVEAQAEGLDLDAVVASIKQAVAARHDVQVYAIRLLRPGGILKTTSGKIQRGACKASFLAGTLETV